MAPSRLDNPGAPGASGATFLPAPQCVLYLGRNSAAIETLRALLQDSAFAAAAWAEDAPVTMNGSHGPAAAAAGASASAPALPPPLPPSGQWQLEVLRNQKAALKQALAQAPALVLVETANRTDSRLRFCQAVRTRLPTAAIIALVSGRSAPFDFPFDAQLRLPVEPDEALAALRQVRAQPQRVLLRRGPIVLDLAARRVHSPKGEREMTPKQCALLELLMRSERVVPRAEIMQSIWETSYLADTRTLDVHIHWLRDTIEPDPTSPVYLITHRGVGYRFHLPEQQP